MKIKEIIVNIHFEIKKKKKTKMSFVKSLVGCLLHNFDDLKLGFSLKKYLKVSFK